ncbi:MAG: CmcI family methyltransferase [Myxococcales bacterium]|nr:hypothetical protein [Myxococcales bacterium]HIK86167.1 hypothetical protein [Myxococcales bacterium]
MKTFVAISWLGLFALFSLGFVSGASTAHTGNNTETESPHAEEIAEYERAINLPISRRRVEFILGSSTDPEVVEKVHQRAKGKRVMVLLDSLHSKKHVAAELKAYAPLVPVGGYLIVQDTPVGPGEAIAEFLAANDNWIADRRRERYPDTNSVNGYLRRIKP